MKLSRAEKGIYKITSILGGRRVSNRCSSIGIIVGREVEVITNLKHSPLYIRIKNSNFSIGKGFADKIEVE